MPNTLELEITGLALLALQGRTSATRAERAQLLWLKGAWNKVPAHKPVLTVDLACVSSAQIDGIDNDVVRLPDGRNLLLVDLAGTELDVDHGTSEHVALNAHSHTLPAPGNNAADWDDLRFIASMDLVTTSRVHRKFVGARHQGQVQGRILFDKGSFTAAMPHYEEFRHVWQFRRGRAQAVSDRLVWRYSSPADAIRLRITRRGSRRGQAELALVAYGEDDTIPVSATCYPALKQLPLPRPAARYGSVMRWDDFPLYYELLSPETPRARRARPSPAGPPVTIRDGWCPTVIAEDEGAAR
jgi:hypothetical protein